MFPSVPVCAIGSNSELYPALRSQIHGFLRRLSSWGDSEGGWNSLLLGMLRAARSVVFLDDSLRREVWKATLTHSVRQGMLRAATSIVFLDVSLRGEVQKVTLMNSPLLGSAELCWMIRNHARMCARAA